MQARIVLILNKKNWMVIGRVHACVPISSDVRHFSSRNVWVLVCDIGIFVHLTETRQPGFNLCSALMWKKRSEDRISLSRQVALGSLMLINNETEAELGACVSNTLYELATNIVIFNAIYGIKK